MIEPTRIPEALARLAGEVAGQPAAAFHVQKLKGDASSRSYHRVHEAGASFVAMVLPPDAKRSEEAVAPGEIPAELPFLDVQRYLAGLGLPVPQIHRVELGLGVLLLKDRRAITRGGPRHACAPSSPLGCGG